jgi:hypothetical protein
MSATMNSVSATSSPRANNALQPILLGGLIAGTLDMTAACVQAWLLASITPFQVARFIASGVVGPAARSGGGATVALGFAFHYLIATTAAAVYYFASRKLPILVERPISMGLLYGVFVYLFMNFVVVPLSKIGFRPSTLQNRAIAALIIMFCIGLPIALIVRRFSK